MAVVGGAPKPPMLKLTAAGLVFNPNPPKLKPPAVVLTAPKPPNPDRSAPKAMRRQRQRERKREEKKERESGEREREEKRIKPVLVKSVKKVTGTSNTKDIKEWKSCVCVSSP